MKNVAVFAHYDKDNLIDDYVLYYLKELKLVCERIIFVSDCNIEEKELQKLKGIADYILAEKHMEYDFGSYKRGYKLAKEQNLLEDADNLIFVNDSCYGPFYPLSSVFEEMQAKECDFWGISANINKYNKTFIECNASNNKHIQSYFIVLKRNVFNSEVFANFIENIKKEKNKENIIIKYEIGLSNELCNNGYTFSSLSENAIFLKGIDDTLRINKSTPFIFVKTSIFKAIYFIPIFANFKNKLKKHSNYSFDTIINHVKRIRKLSEFKFKYIRQQIIKLHIKEHKIFFLGKWYTI